MTHPPLPGGCLCGAVRFTIASHSDAVYCHCNQCRKSCGMPVSAWAEVPEDGFSVATGTAAHFVVDGGPARYFCATCGTTLYLRSQSAAHYFVALGALDEPEAITPRVHRCVDTQLAWLKLHDLMPFYDGPTPAPHDERTYYRGPKDDAVTRDSAVALRPITKKNLRDVLVLDVRGPQRRFVALNSVSLAQAQFDANAWHRAVYADEVVVGFVMLTRDEENMGELPTKGQPFLWRFMIDERYQRMGFGRRALGLVLKEVASWDSPTTFWTSAVSGSGSPYPFYVGLGFQDTGVLDEGENVLRLDLLPAS